MTILRWVDDHADELVAMRRDLHAHPEVSGDEHRTTAIGRSAVEEVGYSVRPLPSGTGLIADSTWPVADGARRVAIRSDLDALAMPDLKDVAYRSTVAGVAHACGHDVHTTVGVGLARALADTPPPVAVRFMFQPAEERVPGGARELLAVDALADVDVVLGVHCEPKLPCGTIGLVAGAITSAADMVTIDLTGPGGHTARPELTIDLVDVAARVITEVPAAVSAAADPHVVKLVFGAVQAGDAANVIPTHAVLRASARTQDLDVWESLDESVRSAVADAVGDSGAGCEVTYTRGVPPAVNDAGVIDHARTAVAALGDVRVVDAVQSWGGDDFAWLTREVPGAYVRLGVHDVAAGDPLDLHAGYFDVDERAIGIGVRLLAATIDSIAASP